MAFCTYRFVPSASTQIDLESPPPSLLSNPLAADEQLVEETAHVDGSAVGWPGDGSKHVADFAATWPTEQLTVGGIVIQLSHHTASSVPRF